MSVFRSVDKWLTARREFLVRGGEDAAVIEAHMSANVNALIPLVRFPMMTPHQLAGLLLSPLLERHKELFFESMKLGMLYHTHVWPYILRQKHRSVLPIFLQVDQLPPNLEPTLFTPRLYTAKCFCETLSVDSLSMMQPYQHRSLIFGCQRTTSTTTKTACDSSCNKYCFRIMSLSICITIAIKT